MSRWILIALILLTVAGLHPAPVTAAEAQTIENCWDGSRLRPVPGRWYKVAERTNDFWPDGGSYPINTVALTPVPGMPQALGFDSWQAMYEDIMSLDGMITDVGLWHDSNFGNESGNYFERHPAGLVPEGKPYMNSTDRWLYFTWSRSPYPGQGIGNQALIRVQGVTGFTEEGPAFRLQMEMDFAVDNTFALYVKM